MSKLQKSPSGFAALLCQLDYIWNKSVEIIISGKPQQDDFREIVSQIHEKYFPNKILVYADPIITNNKKVKKKFFPIPEESFS